VSENRVNAALDALRERREELRSLAEQKDAFEDRQKAALERQLALEKEIVAEGGEVRLPSRLIYSPNYRPTGDL